MPQVASRYLSPPEIARSRGVDAHKILAWIESGELKAVNLATSTSGRPRWKVSPADLAAFEASRSAGPQPKVSRVRRRKNPNIVEFF
jgi:hypothetical protein